MNTKTNESLVILAGWRLSLARFAWWFIFIFFLTFKIFDLRTMLPVESGKVFALLYTIVYFALSIFSLLLAILLYWKKSTEWIAILVSMMFASFLQDGSSFWRWLLEQGWISNGLLNSEAMNEIAGNLALICRFISWGIFLMAFLNFPTGRWIFAKIYWTLTAWAVLYWMPKILEIAQIGAAGFHNLLQQMIFVLSLMMVGILQWIHYFKTPNPAQHQQIKWVVVFFVVSILFDDLITFPVGLILPGSRLSAGTIETISYLNNSLTALLVLGWMMAFSIAIFRYRLWDIDLILNRALVYSSLTGLLGLIGIASAAGIDYFISEIYGEKTSFWSTLIAALPIAASFKPLLNWLQDAVDKYFKPEDVDFSGTFVEFTSPAIERLEVCELTKILADQAAKQLKLDSAFVYLQQPDGKFVFSTAHSASRSAPPLKLNKRQLSMLECGEIATASNESPFSTLVPLVVPRARIPDLVGVLALGTRLESKGYSTQTLKNIQELGKEAGKTIYLAVLTRKGKSKREHSRLET